MAGVVSVVVLAEIDLLAALGDDAEGGDQHAVDGLRGRGHPREVQPRQRLDRAVVADRPSNPLDELLPIRLRPTPFALTLLMVQHSDGGPAHYLFVPYGQVVENSTSILENHPVPECST